MTTDERERRAFANVDMMPCHPVGAWEDLIGFLDGAPSSFTGLLVTLIEKADPANRARLRDGFPFEVRAWETWRDHSPRTWGELAVLLRAADSGSGSC